MTTPIQDSAKDLQPLIFAEKYYVGLYDLALQAANMSEEGIEKCEYADRDIILMINDFHERLPDSPEIRRSPFMDVCNIAEHIFDLYEKEIELYKEE